VAKPSRKTRVAGPYRTLQEFAEGLRTPLSTVSGWIRHDLWKWPKRAPWPRVIAPEVLRWAADNLERGRPAKEKSDPVGTEKIKDLREQKLRQEIRKLGRTPTRPRPLLARERGALHDADECEEEAVRRATLYRNAVQNVPAQVVSLALSNGMPHEASPSFHKQIEELVNGCLRFTAAAGDAQPETGDDAGAEGAVAAGAVDAFAMG
jgi:hypothetical protein